MRQAVHVTLECTYIYGTCRHLTRTGAKSLQAAGAAGDKPSTMSMQTLDSAILSAINLVEGSMSQHLSGDTQSFASVCYVFLSRHSPVLMPENAYTHARTHARTHTRTHFTHIL